MTEPKAQTDLAPREPQEGGNIYQRVNAVRKAVGYVKKDATVKQGGTYKAVSHDAVIAACRAAMVENGVICTPSLIRERFVDTGTTTSGGTPIYRYEGIFRVTFVNCDEPSDSFSMRLPAHAMDTGDKAPGKAITYVTKSALLKAFSLETGEEDESRVEGNRPRIDAEQAEDIERLLVESGADRKQFLAWLRTQMKARSIAELPAQAYDDVIAMLENKRKRANKEASQ